MNLMSHFLHPQLILTDLHSTSLKGKPINRANQANLMKILQLITYSFNTGYYIFSHRYSLMCLELIRNREIHKTLI